MKKYPNASILSLITQTIGTDEKLLFIYMKPIPDFYSFNKIHWYEGAGKDGKASNVWEKLLIKQWVACGKDSDINHLYENVISTGNLLIDKKKIPIVINPFRQTLHRDYPLLNRGESIYDSLTTENNTLIPQEFYQKENLKFLSGYKTGSVEIKPFFSLGFFEDGFIYNKLKKDIWGIKEHRTAYLTFHGVRATSKKGIGSIEMVGFYQQNFNPASNYFVIVKNESNIEIGKTLIDKNTGYFKIKLSEPTKKGIVEVLINEKVEKTIEYVLIQDIQFNSHIADTTFKDAYDRDFMITSDKKNRPDSIPNFTWQQNVYADPKEANQKLSDLFKTIFDYLGPNVLIADPYFLNNIHQDKTTKILSLTHCQTAFINALIHSAIEKGINQINILGYWARAKNHIEKDELIEADKIDQLFDKYEKIFRDFITQSQLESYFPLSTVIFRNAKEDFHSRYWFSLTKKDGNEVLDKCVIITNSIGNIIEVDLIPVLEESQLRQITRKYTGLFKNSEPLLSI